MKTSMVRENESASRYSAEPIEEATVGTPEERGDVLVEAVAPAPVVPSPEPVVPSTPVVEPGAKVEEPVVVAAEPVADPTPEGLKPDHKIPKARFDEVNTKYKDERAARIKAEEALAAATAPKPATDFDFDAKETAYMQAIVDGEHEQALVLRREIRAAEATVFEAKAAAKAESTVAVTDNRKAFDVEVTSLNTRFPAFDPTNETFDQALVDDTLAMYEGFVGRGMAPALALRKAAETSAKVAGLVDALAPAAPAAVVAPVTPAAKPVDVKGKLAAQAAQPAPIAAAAAAAAQGAPIDIAALTEAEFDALPEATKARLRGDLG